MSDTEARFKSAYDKILEGMPDPPPFDEIGGALLRPPSSRRSPVVMVVVVSVVIVLAVGAVGVFRTPQVAYSTYTDAEGGVWMESDCPSADHLLLGEPDGLPHKGDTDLEKVEALVGDGGETAVVPRNGGVWERVGDGSITVTIVQDYMIEVTIADANQCPARPMVNNGVPLFFRIRNAP